MQLNLKSKGKEGKNWYEIIYFEKESDKAGYK